ncbi:MAG: S-layer homology domain-containing protein, partial [Oscillospiraceae bacterium]|nr:S-layer homology domain-containing protein [Oscillospiraceae bacterium]
MKRILSLLLILTLCFSLVSTAFAASASDFSDYQRNAWYSESMEAAVKNGLLRGDDCGLLRPDGNLTRAEMAAIMNRAFGAYKAVDISQFRDVQSNKWYYEDMRKAVHMGTYEGNGNGTMTPDNPIRREEAMAVVARALQLNNDDYSGTDLSTFPDHASISSWAVPYVKAMVGADYIHGNPQHQLTPRANITRAEFAQIFFNIIKEYVVSAGEYTGNRTGNLLVRASGVTLKDMTVNGDLIIGCGAADGTVTLDNVTVTGRVVVWGGGTNAVFMNGGSNMKT